jgi:hypothetical protein
MKNTLIIFAITLFVATACKKEEGVGGESTIMGKVIQKDYDKGFSVLQAEFPAAKEDVFIVYGNDESFGDKTETNYDGTFMFEYLRPGDYKIYIYSEDTTGLTDGKYAVIQNINISSDGKTVTTDNFIKYNSLKVDDGTSSITGTVVLYNWKANFTEIKDSALAQDEDVYLTYGNNESFDLRVRTNEKGVFEFPNLIKGDYTIYVFSDNTNGATQKIPVYRYVSITEKNKEYTVARMYKDKQ